MHVYSDRWQMTTGPDSLYCQSFVITNLFPSPWRPDWHIPFTVSHCVTSVQDWQAPPLLVSVTAFLWCRTDTPPLVSITASLLCKPRPLWCRSACSTDWCRTDTPPLVSITASLILDWQATPPLVSIIVSLISWTDKPRPLWRRTRPLLCQSRRPLFSPVSPGTLYRRRYSHFSGINRKIQFKFQPSGYSRIRSSTSTEEGL